MCKVLQVLVLFKNIILQEEIGLCDNQIDPILEWEKLPNKSLTKKSKNCDSKYFSSITIPECDKFDNITLEVFKKSNDQFDSSNSSLLANFLVDEFLIIILNYHNFDDSSYLKKPKILLYKFDNKEEKFVYLNSLFLCLDKINE